MTYPCHSQQTLIQLIVSFFFFNTNVLKKHVCVLPPFISNTPIDWGSVTVGTYHPCACSTRVTPAEGAVLTLLQLAYFMHTKYLLTTNSVLFLFKRYGRQ